jgi:hypothetical protein
MLDVNQGVVYSRLNESQRCSSIHQGSHRDVKIKRGPVFPFIQECHNMAPSSDHLLLLQPNHIQASKLFEDYAVTISVDCIALLLFSFARRLISFSPQP